MKKTATQKRSQKDSLMSVWQEDKISGDQMIVLDDSRMRVVLTIHQCHGDLSVLIGQN